MMTHPNQIACKINADDLNYCAFVGGVRQTICKVTLPDK